MNAQTERLVVDGPAGAIDCAVDAPPGDLRGVAVLCHPHPQHGGTMDNKVVHTLARAVLPLGWRAVRFNFRGVGGSAGQWDHGHGEIDDALAVIESQRVPGLPLLLGGFSFGGHVAASANARLDASARARRLVLVAPAVKNFPTPPVPADTVLVHGEIDDVVTLADLLDWARPQHLAVSVVSGVGHFFHGRLTQLRTLVHDAVAPHAAL